MRLKIVALSALLLIACDRQAEAPEPGLQVDAPSVLEVAAADAFGAAGEAITDVAFWSHPSIAFEGLLIAATSASATAFRIETGEPAFEIPDGGGNLEVFYSGKGASAQGYLLAKSGGAYRVFRISQDGKRIDPLALTNSAAADGAFCARGGAAPAIVELSAGRVFVRPLTIIANGAELGDQRSVANSATAIGCHVDPLSDEIITASSDGAIHRVDLTTGAVFGVALPKNFAAASSAFAVGRDEAGEPVTQIALLDGNAGIVSLFDAKDGHALGAVRIKATFDLEAVTSARHIAVGSANFGGVYRDGALAVVTSGAGPPIRLVPWNGIMGALSLSVPAPVDPRSPRSEPAGDSFISIEVIEP